MKINNNHLNAESDSDRLAFHYNTGGQIDI